MKHSMLKCLSLVLALATIAGVFAVPALAVVNTCNHYAYEENWTYIGEKQPTCTEYGGKVYECPECDKQFVDSRDWADGKYLPLDHDWDEVDRQEATYGEAGWIAYECSRCDATKTEPIADKKCPNDSCVFVEKSNTATCTTAGVKTLECSVCAYSYTEEAPAKGHAWDDGAIVKAPICGVDENGDPNYGTVKFSCTVEGCNGTRVDDKVLPAQGSHKWEWVEAKAAQCGVDGNTAGYKCVYCDAQHPTEAYTVIPAPAHQWVAKEDAEHVNVALGCQDEVIWEQCSACLTWRDASNRTATGIDGNHYLVWAVDGDYSYIASAKAATMEVIRAASCEDKAVYGCTECDYTVKSATAKPHNFDASLKREPTCQQYGAYVCGDCGAVAGYKDLDGNILNPELNKKPHEADANGKTIVAPGCTQQGYTTYTCKWCNEVQKEDYTNALGHDKSWTEAEDATCTEGGCTKGWVCARGNDCDAKSEWEPSTSTNALGHEYALRENLPANCTYGVHSAYLCIRCDIYDPDRAIVSDNGQSDPSKHVWDPNLTLKTEPTCEKPGSVRMYCSVCFAEDENEITPTHHSFEIVENGAVVGLKNPIGRVPATCTTPGYDVYYCTNENCDITIGADKFYNKGTVQNGMTFVFGGSYALDIKLQDRYDSHYAYANFVYDAATGAFTTNFDGVAHDADGKTGTNAGYVITVVNGKATGSCAQASYLEYKCDDCGYTYNKKQSDDYGLTGAHVASDPMHQDATCTQNGFDGKIVCERCAAVLEKGTTLYPAHDYDKANVAYPYSENVAPTCLTYGWAKAGWCKLCQQYVREGELLPTGHAIGEITSAQKADCETEGWDAHYNCANANCDYVLINAAVAGLEGDALEAAIADNSNWIASIRTQGANGYVNGYTVKLGHHVVYAGTVDYACLVDGYDYFECDRAGCDYVEVKDNYYFGFANHRYTDDALVKLNKAGDDYLECADSYLCCANEADATGVCGDKKLVHEAEAHKNAANEVIKGLDTCANWDEAQDHVCQYCDVDFTFAKIHEYLGNYSANSHEADCQNFAHDVNTCNVCGYIWIANVDEAAGYGDCRWELVGSIQLPTFTSEGVANYVCSLCGEEKTVKEPALDGIDFDITVANKNEGQEILDGSVIAVTIKTNSYNYGVASLISTLKYNANLFTYIGFEANNAFGQASGTAVNVDTTKTNVAYAANGVVTILSSTENAANGALQNVVLNGTADYITLYFRVACNAYQAVSADNTFALTSVTARKIDENKNDVAIDAADLYYTDVVDLAGEIYQLANLNADGFIAAEDVTALRALLLVEGYEAVVAGAGDINQDGEINILDFSLLQQYILGMMTYEELVAAVV